MGESAVISGMVGAWKERWKEWKQNYRKQTSVYYREGVRILTAFIDY